jgi:hypothetical protein
MNDMPAHGKLVIQAKHRQVCWQPTILLIILLVFAFKALGGTIVNTNDPMTVGILTSEAEVQRDPRADATTIALVPAMLPEATRGAPRSITWTSSRILKEVGKQAVDQPGHFLVGAAPIWASRGLVGVPWFGWVAAPILAYREWLQWPSNRWWDPPLDWAFLTLGALMATWRRRPGHRLAGGVAALRQSLSALAVRDRVRHAG